MDKKNYFAPEMEVVEVEMSSNVLLDTSDPKVDYGEGSADEDDLA